MPPTLTVKSGASTSLPLTPQPINTTTPTQLGDSTSTAILIRSYAGDPDCPSSHSLLSSDSHKRDLFTIHFTLNPSTDIPGDSLFLSNHLPRTISKRLPYWFPAAWKALRLFDPGISGDLYAAQPYVSSPILSSMTRIRITRAEDPPPSLPVEEDMKLAGVEMGDAERRKWFLKAERRREFVFRKEWRVEMAFANEFIDFPGFAVVVPGLGWRVGVLRFWDGDGVKFILGGEAGKEARGVIEFNVEMRDGEVPEEEEEPGVGDIKKGKEKLKGGEDEVE